jgi:hypothetical protein
MCHYDRIPESGSFIKNRDLSLAVVEAKFKVKGPASGKSLCAASSHGRRRKGKWGESLTCEI